MAAYSKRQTVDAFLTIVFVINMIPFVPTFFLGGAVLLVATFPLTLLTWLFLNRPLSLTPPANLCLVLLSTGEKEFVRESGPAAKGFARAIEVFVGPGTINHVSGFRAFVLGRRMKVTGARTVLKAGGSRIKVAGKGIITSGREGFSGFRCTGLILYAAIVAVDVIALVAAARLVA